MFPVKCAVQTETAPSSRGAGRTGRAPKSPRRFARSERGKSLGRSVCQRLAKSAGMDDFDCFELRSFPESLRNLMHSSVLTALDQWMSVELNNFPDFPESVAFQAFYKYIIENISPGLCRESDAVSREGYRSAPWWQSKIAANRPYSSSSRSAGRFHARSVKTSW